MSNWSDVLIILITTGAAAQRQLFFVKKNTIPAEWMILILILQPKRRP
jgi:hypothetical protein